MAKAPKRLGVGMVGSGFNARFHMLSWTGIRDADILGVWSPNRKNAESAAAYARSLDIGPCKAYRSIADMVADKSIDAIWISGPNQARIENFEELSDTIVRGRGDLRGVACEKPLARNVAEARLVAAFAKKAGVLTGYLENQCFAPQVERGRELLWARARPEARLVAALAKKAGVLTGYLENQCFAPQVERGRELLWARGAALTGRPYLARAAEEHSGPHMPWFWRGELQGGGVLNDMMCHSALVVRQLLTKPGESLSTVKPVRITGHIASLKWTRPEYVKKLKSAMGPEVNYAVAPSEDFASVMIEFETNDGYRAMGEATTSWSFVGAGLRLSAELLGPEYSMRWNTLDSGLQLFFSREVQGTAGEDLVEKQNAETGVMPVVANEAVAYGYEAENRHFVRAFLGKEKPLLTFDDGLEVVKVLMTAYQSAERGRTLDFPPEGIEDFVPDVAKGGFKLPRARPRRRGE